MPASRISLAPFVALLLAMLILTGRLYTTAFQNPDASREPMSLNESFRPQYHFTPPTMWLNDPNGLVYYKGEYHLFYQYHPESTVWGPMHWGHAVSSDLVNWQHLPIALYPDEIGLIFSGSAVIDWQNTAGFGKEAMIAIFTYHHTNNRQSQGIAFSTDKGRTWTKYAGNPVIPAPANIRNFRDPKVFWYGNQATGHWVMSLAAGSAVLFYTSPNLLAWEPSGSFGFGFGSTSGVWETPDIFELPIDSGPDTRWVLTLGLGGGGPAGGSGTQYFIGHFDGETFTSENPKNTVLWADFGADYYAAQSWSDEPNGRRLMIGWMNNWQYANVIPTGTWRGTFTLPRELSLTQTEDGIRLVQQPIPELQILRATHRHEENLTLSSSLQYPLQNLQLEILADIQIDPNTDHVGLRLHTCQGEQTTLGYAIKERRLYVDRSAAGIGDFNSEFAKLHLAHMPLLDGNLIRLHVFVDNSSIEVFANDGTVVMTEQIFPCGQADHLELFVEGGEVTINTLDIYELKAATFYTSRQVNKVDR